MTKADLIEALTTYDDDIIVTLPEATGNKDLGTVRPRDLKCGLVIELISETE